MTEDELLATVLDEGNGNEPLQGKAEFRETLCGLLLFSSS
jgi:hypothetical protein